GSPCTDTCAARTRPRGPHAASFVPQLAQHARIVGPGFAHLDPGAEVHLAAEELLHVLARRARHALQACAAGADDDRFLAVALDEYRGLDPPQPALLLEAFDHHLATIRQLLAHFLEQLLAQ